MLYVAILLQQMSYVLLLFKGGFIMQMKILVNRSLIADVAYGALKP
jgi:hypothetical protein